MGGTDFRIEDTGLMPISTPKQLGFTLVELLISLVIGATLVLIAGNMFVGTIKSNASITGETELRESSYFLSMTLSRHLSQAGFRALEPSSVQRALVFPVPTKESFFEAVSGEWVAGQYVKFDSQKLSIRFGGADTGSVPDLSMIDCIGDTVDYQEIGVMEFSVENNQLLCKSSGSTEVLAGFSNGTIVENIAVSFGIDDDGDSSTDRFVSGAVATLSDLTNVSSMELRLLLASADKVTANQLDYTFDGTSYSASDRRSRLENITFVAMRN